MSVPTRNQWKQLKKTYSIPDGAAKGIDFGKELDKVQKALDKAAQTKDQGVYLASLKVFEPVAAKYIQTVDRKKITKFDEFQKTFINDYVREAHRTLENVALEADGKKLYVSQLQKFFGAVQALASAPTINKTSVDKFSQFARGLSSVALRTKGAVDPTDINGELARIDTASKRIKANPTAQELQDFVDVAVDVAKDVADHAVAQRLIKSKPPLR